ncbi:MAG: hypothetical protein R3B93_08705 [Bacteroidia bacterium]
MQHLNHVFPKPDLLPKEQWETVLPMMGARLGMPSDTSLFDPFRGKSMDAKYSTCNPQMYIHSKPVLSQEDWTKIQAFFMEHAPDTISHSDPEMKPATDLFFLSVYP